MYTITLLFLALFTLYIAAFGFFRWDASFLCQGDTPAVRFLVILVCAIFLIYGLLLIFHWLKRLNASSQKYVKWGLSALILLGQLAFLLYFQPSLRYDALSTFDQAVEMLSTQTISETYGNGYFARYTNNYPITILTYWLLSFARTLGVPASGYMLFVQLLNVFLLDAALFLGYRLLVRLQGKHAGLFYLILCTICPTTYMWTGFFYTSTLSMPFFMGILLLFFHIFPCQKNHPVLRQTQETPSASGVLSIQDTSSPSGAPSPQATSESRLHALLSRTKGPLLLRYAQGFLLGLCVIMGYKFRATALIAFIAFCIAGLYQIPWRSFLKPASQGFFPGLLSGALSWLRQKGKSLLALGLSFLLACVLFSSLWNASVSRYVAFDYRNTGFPAIHWVMMGFRWDGAYDQTDELYTFSFPTREEKVAADKELLIKRIQEAGPGGIVSLMGRKLLNTWVDGTDTSRAENSAISQSSRYGRLFEYLLGNKDGFFTIYAQVFRVIQMLVLGWGALCLLWNQWKKKEKPSPLFLLQLALLGGMSFHLIWETNPLYSLSFAALTMTLMAAQTASIFQSMNRPFLRAGRILCPAGFVCLLVLVLLGKKQLVETPIEENIYCVNQYQYTGGIRPYVEEYEEIYTQTFVTDQPFNRLSIHAVNPVGEYNQSAFIVEIKDSQNRTVYYNDRFLSGLVEKNKNYEFAFDLVEPDGPTTYTLTISPGYIHGEDSLQFLYYHTGNADLYEDGSLAIAGKELKNGDLAFSVYEYQVTTRFNWKVYLMLCILIAGLCGAVTAGIWRKKS